MKMKNLTAIQCVFLDGMECKYHQQQYELEVNYK